MRLTVQKLLAVWVITLSCSFIAFGQNDLSLGVSTTSGTVAVGDNGIQFTVTVTNQGATSVNDVEVTISIPTGLTLTGNTPSAGTYNTGTGIWDIGAIANTTGSVTLTLTFDVVGEGVQTLSANITNMAEVDGDSDPADNSVLEDDYGAACVSAPFEYCAGETIDITATAPAGHNSYQWKLNGADIPGATSQTYNITAAGNYSYTVNAGATGSCAAGSCCDIQVIENALPSAGITNNTGVTELDCINTSISLTATGGGTYLWSDAGATTTANLSVTTPGTYTVTVTSGDGCTATSQVVITEDTTPPTAGITNNTGATELDCNNTSISLTATGGGTYLWSDAGATTTANLSVTTPGTYTVTVTGTNGCTATSQVVITEDTTPPTAGITNNDGTTELTCNQPSISLTATGGGTYLWSDAGATTTANLSVTAAGTYTVTVTGTNGCTATSQLVITEDTTPPTAGITNNTGVTELDCNNTSISLTATGGGTYLWSDAGATTTANLSVTTPGTYTVTVTAANGCTATSQLVITEDTTPPTAGITNNTGATELDCNNTSISLTATGGGTYLWSDAGATTTANLSVTTPGTYTVTVTAANGCTATSQLVITEDTTPPTAGITNNTGTNQLTCTTTSISLTATGGGTYLWSDAGATTIANLSVTAPGTYTVTVTGTNGCTATSQTIITEDVTPPTAGITNNDGTTEITCTQTSISLTATGGVSYLWSDAGATTTANLSVTTAGTYTVTVTGTNGCTATSQTVITGSCTVDYADLPDGTAGNGPGDYNTTSANGGPSHGIVTGLTLGSNIDAESDGQPSANADGDDTDGGDDDDGMSIGSTFDIVPGGTIRIPYDGTNSTGSNANLVAWVDWNNDGVFSPGEQVTPVVIPGTGPFSGHLSVPVPDNATTGSNIGILVRLSNSAISSPDGYLSSGEVESYMLSVNCPTQICLPATSTKN